MPSTHEKTGAAIDAPRFAYDAKRDTVSTDGIPGFYDSWAYHTGDESGDWWEIDLTSHSGLDGHIIIPYTKNMQIFETRLHAEVHRLWVVALELQSYRLASNPR